MNTDTEATVLSLVVPAYNEESKIARDLEVLTGYLDANGMSYEIIVVDDGSGDSTSRIVSGFAVTRGNIILLRNDENRGKGYSVRRGILSARGKYIAFLDAGLCVPPAEIRKAVSYLDEGYDIALGSRALPDSHIGKRQPWYRIAGSILFAWIVKHIMGLGAILDTQCGFKFFTRAAALEIFTEMRTDGFMFDVELLRRATAKKMRIMQFPITWSNDPDTRLRLVSGSVNIMRELLRMKLRERGA